jgi:hypothetical protein
MMEALVYGLHPWVLGLILTLVLFLAVEVGFRVGRRRAEGLADTEKSQSMTLQAAVLGFLALLLGFSFSVSFSRFDTRRRLVIDEANAIETTYLRAGILPPAQQQRVRGLLRGYSLSRTPRATKLDVDRALAQSERLHTEFWREAERFGLSDADPGRKTLFTSSLNEMIDLHTERVAAYLFRAPPASLLLLGGAGLLAVVVMGYATGVNRRRQTLGLTVMVVLIAGLTTVIVDLENGRAGVVQPSRQPLLDVQKNIGALDAAGPGSITTQPAGDQSAASATSTRGSASWSAST